MYITVGLDFQILSIITSLPNLTLTNIAVQVHVYFFNFNFQTYIKLSYIMTPD